MVQASMKIDFAANKAVKAVTSLGLAAYDFNNFHLVIYALTHIDQLTSITIFCK
jgi:hypothetical protein